MMLKWIFDRVVALIGLLVLWPALLIVAVLVKIKMPGGPAFFVQKRVGRNGRQFKMYKFRSMTVGHGGSSVSVAGESRITPFGAKLRKYKLDELPELWNVLIGDMSFVGPRPDVPGYADALCGEDREVLKLRPGITGPASLKYRNEEELLAKASDPQKYNDEVIFPDKVRINRYYLHHYSFWADIKMIFATVLGLSIEYAGEVYDGKLDIIQTINTMQKRIYLCLAHMSGQEQKFIQEAFDTNWVVPLGPNVNGFEADLHRFMRMGGGGVALSSGTAAVHLALIACGVKPGDEVFVQSFTFCASSHPVTYLGANPIFIDSEPDTWNMNPELLEHAIKDRIEKTGKKPKAIIPVALYGMPYQIDKIQAIAERYEIPIIEDAAEGFGSQFDGKVLGTFGKYGVLSFNGNKMITTSGGGALACQDAEDAEKIMWYATQAREAYPYYQHEAIGYNYRLSNICAGIGRGQMTVADEHIAHHKHVYELYKELFADVEGIEVHGNPSSRYDSNFWLNTITIDPSVRIKGQENAYKATVKGAVGGAAGVVHATENAHTDCEPNDNVEALRMVLDAAGIEARPLWKPMHKQPVYKNAVAYVNGVSESLFKVGMCLPSGPYVTDDDVRYIVETIKQSILPNS